MCSSYRKLGGQVRWALGGPVVHDLLSPGFGFVFGGMQCGNPLPYHVRSAPVTPKKHFSGKIKKVNFYWFSPGHLRV